MKKILFFICLLLIVSNLEAQLDRSKAPQPGPARSIKIGEYQTFTLKNGLQVFVVENHKLPTIQFALQLKNEAIFQGEKEGYVGMAGTLIGTGTTTRSKAQLDEEVDFIGADLTTTSTAIFASSLSKHSSKLAELMADVLYNPVFSPDEFEKLKAQTLSGIAASKDDPNSIASNVSNSLMFGKQHPYGLFSTEKSIAAITLDDIKGYYQTYFKPNNAYLIIVGDIDLKVAKGLTEKHFSKWVKGDIKSEAYAQPKEPSKIAIAVVDRPASVQSVINVGYAVDLKPGSPDAIKARVLNQILGGGFSSRLMQNLREKHAYTYGARSSLRADALTGSFVASASVRNEVTDSAVYEFILELRRLVNEPVSEKELAAAKAEIAGSFGRSLESPQTIAEFALNTAKYNLPKDYYANYLKAVEAVTLADVQAASKKYIHPENLHVVIVGKASDIADKLKAFGDVKFYDINGDPYTPLQASSLPTGLTAERVVADYIQAIGGEKQIANLKSLKTTMKATIQGTELTLENSKKSPGKSLMELSAAGMGVMQKSVTDGQAVAQVSQGQKAPMDGAEKEKGLFEAYIVPEVMLAKLNVKAVLKSIENVDGKEAYVVEYTFPAGGKITNYFDKETSLKIQTVEFVKTAQGDIAVPTLLKDYKEINGVKIPHTLILSTGPMKLNFVTTSAEANVTLSDSTFKVD